MEKNIWTIGHSNHSMDNFLQLLHSFEIKTLIDVRRFPGSKKFPHFNKAEMQGTLKESGIDYLHFEALGGRRKPLPDSHNDRWENEAFRGYADYMETEEFRTATDRLTHIALIHRTAIMCSEAKWWQCHRALISDYLKTKNWKVWHIMGKRNAKEHPFSPAAKMILGKLDYSKKNEDK